MPKPMGHIKIRFCDETEAKGQYLELRFYNVPIKKPCIKHPMNIDFKHLKDMQEVIELK